MAVTTTPRFALPQYGAGSDSPSRQGFNAAFATIDAKAAYDDGAVGGTALPTTDLVNGRYAQTVDGAYRRVFRRAGGNWQQIGGNTWAETQYARADAALGTSTPARVTSHPSISGGPTVTENWDGSSSRTGQQSIGDLGARLGSLQIGDTGAADLAAKGRAYVRAQSGQRGVVAAAAAADAGHLFAAVEAGGSVPWYVDSRGRQRAQAPASFGAADLATGVALGTAPGATDTSGLDASAASGKFAQRWWRAVGDVTPIASIEQTAITLGRATWAGSSINLLAAAINLTGPLTVVGAAALGDLDAKAFAADTVTSRGAAQAQSLALAAGLAAENGRVSSASVGSGAELRTRPPTQVSGTAQTSVRAPMVITRRVDIGDPGLDILSSTVRTTDMTFTAPEDGYVSLDLGAMIMTHVGAGGVEMHRGYITLELRSGSSGLADFNAVPYHLMCDQSRNLAGFEEKTLHHVFPVRVTAGTSYTLRVGVQRDSVLGAYLRRLRARFTFAVLHSTS